MDYDSKLCDPRGRRDMLSFARFQDLRQFVWWHVVLTAHPSFIEETDF